MQLQKNTGIFEISYSLGKGFWFRLIAPNNEIIAVSEGYINKQGCLNGIESVRKNAVYAIEKNLTNPLLPDIRPLPQLSLIKKPLPLSINLARFEIFRDIKFQYRFRLIAPNVKIIAVGEGYVNLQGCRNGIEAVRKYAINSRIRDLTILHNPLRKTI